MQIQNKALSLSSHKLNGGFVLTKGLKMMKRRKHIVCAVFFIYICFMINIIKHLINVIYNYMYITLHDDNSLLFPTIHYIGATMTIKLISMISLFSDTEYTHIIEILKQISIIFTTILFIYKIMYNKEKDEKNDDTEQSDDDTPQEKK